MNDQSTPGHEREVLREGEMGELGKGNDEEGEWEG